MAEIFTGHTLREKIKYDSNGACSVIQLRDLSFIPKISIKNAPFKISFEHGIPKNQLLQQRDILILSKGSANRALLYEGQYAPAVAVSAFTIIRLHSSYIKPEFLTWYINSTGAQEYFNIHRVGTTTLNLPKKAIDELPVPIPPLEKQEIMMKLVTQYELYTNLVTEYERNIRMLVDHTLNNQLNDQ
ncbi:MULTISPECIES: restriction endonuclease subunit S [Niastella]|uniref:Restriction endonuclease subunit S n=1 Tax=Niastella soli TaxID=2821487 RepID=A0ABS3YRT9_9BACT|nr:restriction endonuclease subunit S [Niastella soli]MBO9200603.1 restriction endonuclease subunit S [Niastella soli]